MGRVIRSLPTGDRGIVGVTAEMGADVAATTTETATEVEAEEMEIMAEADRCQDRAIWAEGLVVVWALAWDLWEALEAPAWEVPWAVERSAAPLWEAAWEPVWEALQSEHLLGVEWDRPLGWEED